MGRSHWHIGTETATSCLDRFLKFFVQPVNDYAIWSCIRSKIFGLNFQEAARGIARKDKLARCDGARRLSAVARLHMVPDVIRLAVLSCRIRRKLFRAQTIAAGNLACDCDRCLSSWCFHRRRKSPGIDVIEGGNVHEWCRRHTFGVFDLLRKRRHDSY
jgi:hypothetical protein